VYAAVVVVATLAVAGCGSQRAAPPATTHATPPVAGQDGPAAFVARARQVTAQWDRSQAARLWRTGLVLMDPSDLTPVPSNAGFGSQRDKDAFGSGHFMLAGTLQPTEIHFVRTDPGACPKHRWRAQRSARRHPEPSFGPRRQRARADSTRIARTALITRRL
jgi:hypothetical protein